MEEPGLGQRAPRVLVSGLVLDLAQAGVARHGEELLPRAARLLASAGGKLSVLAGAAGLSVDLGPEVECIPSSAASHPAWRRARDEGRALRQALRGATAAGRPFDLVHTSHLPVPAKLPVPFSWLVHDLRRVDRGGFLSRSAGRILMRSAARRADAILAVSEFTARRLREVLGVEAQVVPNACGHFDPLPRRPAAGAPLLHVGHLEPRKNLRLLIRALSLSPELPDLWLAGAAKNGEDTRLKDLAAATGVLDRIRFLGAPEDDEIVELYATCAAVVLPSAYEGFGLTALEALKAGCPLACSDIPAHREITAGHAAFFDPGDVGSCARAVLEALASQPTTEAQTQAERYSWDDSARLLVTAWGALVPRPVTDPPHSP